MVSPGERHRSRCSDLEMLSFSSILCDESRRVCDHLSLLSSFSRSHQTFDMERDQTLTFAALAHT